MPVVANTCVSMKPAAQLVQMDTETCVLPSGRTSRTEAPGLFTLVTTPVIRCPAVALNVSRASCPAVVVVKVTGGPSIAMVPATSAFKVSATLPVLVLNRTGFVGGLIPREDGAHATTQQVLPRTA
jgi:hypothetical protein